MFRERRSPLDLSTEQVDWVGGNAVRVVPVDGALMTVRQTRRKQTGAGVKIVDVTLTETFTDFREEVVQQQASSGYTMTVDGGVGGFTY